MGWLAHSAEPGDPLFGRAFPCPECGTGRRALSAQAGVPTGYRNASDQVESWQRVSETQETAQTVLELLSRRPNGLLEASGAHGVLLCGPTGTGKTTLAVACLERARWVREAHYAYWPDLISRIKDSYGSDTASQEQILHRPTTCQFLILDDLGAGGEIDTRLAISVAERIAEGRTTRDDMWTIVTTNLTPGQIAEHLGARVASRLTNRLACVPVTGPDQRAADKE